MSLIVEHPANAKFHEAMDEADNIAKQPVVKKKKIDPEDVKTARSGQS